jgi:hypothetical protein
MGSLSPFANNNLTQIFFALLPDSHSQQNIGKKEKLSEIQDLLKHGVDVNALIHLGYTPLCKVIKEGGSKALVELLLHYGAKVESLNDSFEWTDTDGQVIRNQVYALARQRSIEGRDKESFEIQHLIQKHLIQKHLANSGISTYSDDVFPSEIFKPPRDSAVTPFPLSEVANKKKIYIFDFENTIVNAHFHHILKDMGVAHGRASTDLVEFLLIKHGIKNKENLLTLWRDILQSENCLCIATHSRYPETVFASLVALGLSEEEIGKIFYNPPDLNTDLDLTFGKNLAILQAMVHFEVIDINAVYLIDHERTNLQIAKGKLNMPEANLIWIEEEQSEEKGGQIPSYLQRVQSTFKKKLANQEIKSPTKLTSYQEESKKDVDQKMKNDRNFSPIIQERPSFANLNLKNF